MFHEADLKKFD